VVEMAVGAWATRGFFWKCLYPHSHSKPIVCFPFLSWRHFLAVHSVSSLWIVQSCFASVCVRDE